MKMFDETSTVTPNQHCTRQGLWCPNWKPDLSKCGLDACPLNGLTTVRTDGTGPTIKGVSPDAEIITNEKGAKQSKTAYGFHLMDTDAMLALAETLQYGATRYARDNWRGIPAEEHFNHMVIHYYAWLKGDRSDNHLAHLFCRAMMLYATAKAEEAERSGGKL